MSTLFSNVMKGHSQGCVAVNLLPLSTPDGGVNGGDLLLEGGAVGPWGGGVNGGYPLPEGGAVGPWGGGVNGGGAMREGGGGGDVCS